jgi:hypothetical protein
MYICCISRRSGLHIVDFKCSDKTIITICGDTIRDTELNIRSLQMLSVHSNNSLLCKKCKNRLNFESFVCFYKNKMPKNIDVLREELQNESKQYINIKNKYGYYLLRSNYRKIRRAKIFLTKHKWQEWIFYD